MAVQETLAQPPRSVLNPKVASSLVYAFLLVVLFIQLFPLWWLFTFSLKDNGEIFAGNIIGLPIVWHWGNYLHALTVGNIGLYLFNSVYISGLAVGACILFSAMAAFGITRLKWKLSKPTLVFFLMGLMIPLHAALLPLFLVLKNAGMLNNPLGLIVPYAGFGLPVAIFIFAGFFESVPKEMEESAFMDGATVGKTFRSIMLPLISPAIATVAIFTFLNTWNELMFASTFISNNLFKTLPVGIWGLASQYRTDWGPIGAAMVVASIPSIVLYSLLSKQVQESVKAGALKG